MDNVGYRSMIGQVKKMTELKISRVCLGFTLIELLVVISKADLDRRQSLVIRQ
ncbi:MAG: type II secretion system protein [Planctomycetota bacterium]